MRSTPIAPRKCSCLLCERDNPLLQSAEGRVVSDYRAKRQISPCLDMRLSAILAAFAPGDSNCHFVQTGYMDPPRHAIRWAIRHGDSGGWGGEQCASPLGDICD